MATRCEIAQSSKALHIRAIADQSTAARLIGAVIVAVFVGTIASYFLRVWFAMPLALVASAMTFLVAKTRSEGLEVTKLEFNTTGNGGGRRRRRARTIFAADASQLKFDAGGYGAPSTHAGLYAITSSKQILLLPFLDFHQTTEVIHAIETKFPGLAERWRAGKPAAGSAV